MYTIYYTQISYILSRLWDLKHFFDLKYKIFPEDTETLATQLFVRHIYALLDFDGTCLQLNGSGDILGFKVKMSVFFRYS
jgi:hypothetical protein